MTLDVNDRPPQLCFAFGGVRRSRAARPLGPWPVEADGVTVRIPIVDRFAITGIGETVIEAASYPVGMSRVWHSSSNGYVIAHDDSGRVHVALHNVIMQPPPGMIVDHVHGVRKDNRRAQLRVVTRFENAANLRLDRTGRSAPYRGVTWHAQTGRWQAAAHHRGRCHYAGLFSTPEAAARAYDRLAAKFWPGIVPLNFPDSLTQEIPMQKTVRLELDRTTKGAFRYREVSAEGAPLEQADAVVGTIYLRKSQLGGQEPKAISVTIDTQAA